METSIISMEQIESSGVIMDRDDSLSWNENEILPPNGAPVCDALGDAAESKTETEIVSMRGTPETEIRDENEILTPDRTSVNVAGESRNENEIPTPSGNETVTPVVPPVRSQHAVSKLKQRRMVNEYYNDVLEGSSGIINVKTETRFSLNTFAMKLKALVEAEESTGYYAEVVRELDKEKRNCFFHTDAIHNKVKFMAQINQSFGSGGMTSGLDASQLIDFFQYLQRSVEGRLPIKKAVVCSGMQPDGSCVINKNVFLSSAGDLINSEKSQYLWLDKELLSENDKIRSVDISPNILLPLSTEPLEDLVATLEIISKHNFHSTLAVMTGAIMAFHFCTIKDLFGGCPIVVAMGPSETGKSTAIRAALALFGMQKISRYVKGTNALFMERASCSTFPFGIEEAVSSKKGKLKLDLTELVIDLYDGAISANMKTGSLTPKCVPVLATNFDVEDMDRLKSRILAVPFNSPSTGPTTEEEEAGYECFENSLRRNFFSSVIGWIVSLRQKLVQSKDEIQTTKLELVDGRGKTRNITGWSILLFFLKKLTSIVKRPDLFEAVKASILDFNSPLTSQQPTSSLSNPQDLVIQFCENIFKVATSITLQQRLEFMRTETEVDNKHVLAIWMKGAAPYFENNDNQVNIVPAVRKSQMGKLSVKREFLIPGRKDSCILKCFSVRRSCITIFLDSLPVQLARNLQQITKQDKSNQKKERPKNSTSLAGPEHSVKPKSSETASNASSSDNPEQGDKPKSSETASNASSSDDPEQGDKPKSSETTCNASSSDDREQGIKPESSEIASNASSSDDPEQGDKPKTSETASNTSGPEQGVKPYDGSECLRNPSSSTFTTATTSESISVLSDSNPSRKQPSRLINNSKGKTPRMPTRNSTKKRKSMNKSRANEEELPPSKRACK